MWPALRLVRSDPFDYLRTPPRQAHLHDEAFYLQRDDSCLLLISQKRSSVWRNGPISESSSYVDIL